jgi:aspartate 1-decarboxylase
LQRIVLKSKIHRATVTRSDVEYDGSLSISPELMGLADILPGEQVHVINLSNGSRAVTYAVEGDAGEIGLLGAIAHLGSIGDLVIVFTYAHLDEAELTRHRARIVQVDGANRPRSEVAVP